MISYLRLESRVQRISSHSKLAVMIATKNTPLLPA